MLPRNHLLQNRYRIIRLLGKGGMGHVYEALDDTVDCIVAIKETFADTEHLRRAFEHEAKLLANLKHPALPRVTHHFREGAGQFLVMEYIEGDNLAELLKKRKRPFMFEELLPCAERLLDALAYLHERSEPIIHRDIKPANIKLTEEDVYLLDFGLAKGNSGQMSTAEYGQSISSVHGFTPLYAPLEQINNSGTNAQSDLYSSFVAYFGDRMAGKISEANQQLNESAREAKQTEWPYPVILCLQRKITADELLYQAVDTDKMTEARAYIGTDLALSPHPDEALPHLRWVKEHGNAIFPEYPLALSLLDRIKSPNQR
jgi:serine/threonine protein kinase